jgi:hypothetical protein
MDTDLYARVLAAVAAPSTASPHFAAAAARLGVAPDTLVSVHAQEAQARVIRSHHALRAAAPGLAGRWARGEAAPLDLAHAAGLPPSVVLRRLLEALPALGLAAPKRATELLRAPASLAALAPPGAGAAALRWAGVADADANTAAAAPGAETPAGRALLARLAAEAADAVGGDAVCGPASDAARHAAGAAAERRLYAALDAVGVAYWTEAALRRGGFHKTPDARLQVPIAVRGRLVCWVDSKATFGDARGHAAGARDQFAQYVNRFGPGLVVYWHGHLAALEAGAAAEGLLLANAFPGREELLALPRLSEAEVGVEEGFGEGRGEEIEAEEAVDGGGEGFREAGS